MDIMSTTNHFQEDFAGVLYPNHFDQIGTRLFQMPFVQ